VFAELDHLEQLLGANRYLTGEYLTEADVRLFTTMIRFDAVYHGHFKCNLRRIADYPNLSNWLRELYQWPGIGETVDFSTSRITTTAATRPSTRRDCAEGAEQDFSVPHDRERLAKGVWRKG
jgi:putative glutathione S-transferase